MIKKYKQLQYLDEKYFSDILKELLTTVGSNIHNFKLEFARKFVEKIYDDNKKYALQNSTIIREYPLNILEPNKHPRTKYLDLLFLDLDETDDVVIGIENKFLTTDSPNQIVEYYEALQRQFNNRRVKIVYLTLDGRYPTHSEYKKVNDLVCMSWIYDILPSIIELKPKKTDKTIKRLIDNLQLIESIMPDDDIKDTVSLDILKEYINEITKNYSSKVRTIETYDTGSYYKLLHNNNKVWIPKSIHYKQAEHMLHQFCITVFNQKIDFNKAIKNNFKLKNLFGKDNINIEQNIKIYLGTKTEKEKYS